MNGSFRIGTAFGIPIQVHWSFLALLILLWGYLPTPPLMVPAMLVLFGCVLLHELGHSLIARHYGIRVIDITLWPLGGMARMSEMPEVPRIEGLIAIGGPLVNFVLVGLGATAAVLAAALAPESFLAWSLPALAVFVKMNLMLGTFNLVPAFPMDGGRILRAWFARSTDWVSATERAVRVGRFVALAMLVLSLVLFFLDRQLLCAIPLIATFVWIAGGRELLAVRLRHGRSPFGGAGLGQSPVFGEGAARPAPSWSGPPAGARNPGRRGEAQRPRVWKAPGTTQGFDEERIRALEDFPGRLRSDEDA